MDVVKKPNAIGHKPNGMTKTPNFVPDEKKINLDFINCNLSEDTSHYTISDKKSPKLATYYFKHEETENNMENDINHEETLSLDNQTDNLEKNQQAKVVAEEIDAQKKNVTPTLRAFGNSRSARPKSLSDDRIRILVQQAEELVSDKRHIGKLSKVNKWLKLEKPDDSCDASGEDDEKESQASDDLDTSSATIRGTDNSNSQNSIQDFDLHLNGKKWLSSASRLNHTSTGMNNFSISESALHQMILPLKGFPASFSAVSSNNINVNSNNSTSSTVEEVLPLIAEKISPARKKKSKLKKRPLVGKSDTHLLYNGGYKIRSHLIKSGSFPGYSTKTTNSNTNVEQEETFTGHTYYAGHSETSTTSGADSEEEVHKSRPANFKYGGRTRYLHHEALRDNKFGKNVIPNTEEQSSSLSEQAWDNYQENYLSEPYSESHDSDAARRLLNFGEDYRKFIDSQSDWSAFSDISPRMKRKSWPQPNDEDSNSDEESLKQLINDSRDQLRYAEDVYEQLKLGVHDQLVTSEIDDLITTCERHIALLKHINESSYEYKMSFVDKAVTADLLDQWRVLKNRSSYMDEYRRLRKQISDLKSFIELQNISERKLNSPEPCGIDDIYNEIDNCNKILDSLSQQSGNLASINALVHRYTLDNQDCEEFNGTALKGDISELYEMFDNARTCVTEELSQLKTLLPVWKILESRLDQLQIDLKMDEKLMENIDYSLTNGMFTDQTVASVREVAKLLSETNNSNAHHNSEVLNEGSYSDSGISDEGSEQEIGERQRRLAAIRRLVRQLETGLSSDSRARLMMREKLRATEDELKALQSRCRSLISRTSACSDRLRPVSEQEVSKPEDSKVKVASGDPDSDPGKNPKGKSWFKRFFKASVTFQLVLLAFVCLSCILEPSCCDYMNNYSWTLSPKLHYEARPPI